MKRDYWKSRFLRVGYVPQEIQNGKVLKKERRGCGRFMSAGGVKRVMRGGAKPWGIEKIKLQPEKVEKSGISRPTLTKVLEVRHDYEGEFMVWGRGEEKKREGIRGKEVFWPTSKKGLH